MYKTEQFTETVNRHDVFSLISHNSDMHFSGSNAHASGQHCSFFTILPKMRCAPHTKLLHPLVDSDRRTPTSKLEWEISNDAAPGNRAKAVGRRPNQLGNHIFYGRLSPWCCCGAVLLYLESALRAIFLWWISGSLGQHFERRSGIGAALDCRSAN